MLTSVDINKFDMSVKQSKRVLFKQRLLHMVF